MATSKYYITAEIDDLLTQVVLDVTSQYSESMRGSLTQFKMGDNTPGSDHITNRNTVYKIVGALSDIKSPTSIFYATETVDGQVVNDLSSSQFTLTSTDGSTLYRAARDNKNRLTKIREQGVECTVHANGEIFDDCYITDLNFSQNAKNGSYTGPEGSSSSYEVSITLERARRARRAEKVTVSNTALAFEPEKKTEGNKKNATTEEQQSWNSRILNSPSFGRSNPAAPFFPLGG